MRAIPVLSRKLMEASSSGEAVLVFVEITHPQTPDVIRLVVDGADYIMEDDDGDDQTWHKSFFELELLTDTDQPPAARFRFPNVDRQAITLMRSIASPPRVAFKLVSAGYFDLTADPRTVKPALTVEPIYHAKSLFLTDITADQVQVEGTLRSWDFRQEQWPDKRVTQALLPGAFVR